MIDFRLQTKKLSTKFKNHHIFYKSVYTNQLFPWAIFKIFLLHSLYGRSKVVNVDIQYGGMSSVLCCVVVRFINFVGLYIPILG